MATEDGGMFPNTRGVMPETGAERGITKWLTIERVHNGVGD